MSRSYRKPILTDGYGTKRLKMEKAAANRFVRRSVGVPNGKAYRKFYETYSIRDYKICNWTRPTSPYIYHSYGRISVIPLKELLQDYLRAMRK